MSTSQRKRDEIIHILSMITGTIYPELKIEWYSWYEYENNALFTEIHGTLDDYATDHFEEALDKCLKFLESINASTKEFIYAEQLLIALSQNFVNRGSWTNSKQNKSKTVYKFYTEKNIFREATIKYATYAPKLLANLYSQSFFEIDKNTIIDVYDNCISQYKIRSQKYKELLDLIRFKFHYNHSFSKYVTSENAYQYLELGEYILASFPKLGFEETNDGQYIISLRLDVDSLEHSKVLREMFDSKQYWIKADELPEIIEFDYLYPNGANGDMIKYLLEEHGETTQKSSTVWYGSFNKSKLDYFEMFAAPAPFISKDERFLEIYKHHVPSALYEIRTKLYSSKIAQTIDFQELLAVLKEQKTEQKARRNELYARLIVEGKTSPKWKSEAQLYSIASSVYPDAVYQYHAEWLGMQSLDIYIPSKSAAIEYQGIQHYQPVEHFGGEEHFKKQQKNDKKKKTLCKEHGIKLIAWSYSEHITEENFIKILKKNKIE